MEAPLLHGERPVDDGVKSLGVSMSVGAILASIWLIVLVGCTVGGCCRVGVCCKGGAGVGIGGKGLTLGLGSGWGWGRMGAVELG